MKKDFESIRSLAERLARVMDPANMAKNAEPKEISRAAMAALMDAAGRMKRDAWQKPAGHLNTGVLALPPSNTEISNNG